MRPVTINRPVGFQRVESAADTLRFVERGSTWRRRRLISVELYDVEHDPLERNNLAVARDKHADVLEAMSAKLNALIEKEVGEDIGQMLPGGVDGGWVATDAVYDV